MALEIDGVIYRVGKNQHVKPGKGGAYVQVRSIGVLFVIICASVDEKWLGIECQ